ncbi:tail protein X [Escherichia coli]|uniref:tail protein X n=1 Tax=Escherichia coli TaxID=562 RepID=UPI0019188B06|nr:tail protein X [Escherichia coli]CAD6040126.1 tail protein X [Escherichia coli]CAD6089971.1 tail protein X [Escherichia coli]CAD6121798.1 tail protein X [Escherichia coli]
MPMIYTTRDGDVLDEICARHYGVAQAVAALPVVLETNRGLADVGTIFPAGVKFTLPDMEITTNEGDFQLWE